MDRDSFITAVFLLGCEQYGIIRKQYRLRRGGFEPALTDEEVITMEICGESISNSDAARIFLHIFTRIIRTSFRNLLTGLCLSARLRIYGGSKELSRRI